MAALPELFQDGIRYVPTKAIAREVGLSPRYLADFCRDGRVTAIFHKGAWYVEENSLRTFLEKQAREREEYNRRLSEEAKQEVERHKAQVVPAVVPAPPPPAAPLRVHRKPAEILLATLTIFAVLASGALAFHDIAPEKFAATVGGVQHAPLVVSSQLAAASSLPWLDSFAGALFRTVCPILRDCPRNDLVAAPAPQPQPLPQAHTGQVATTSKPAVATSSTKNPSSTTIIQNPVIERIREVQTSGINASYVDARIAALAASMQRQFDAMADANATSFRSVSSGGSTPTSVSADIVTGTITNAINSALATITDLTSTTITATNVTFTSATTTNFAATNASTTNLTVSAASSTQEGTGADTEIPTTSEVDGPGADNAPAANDKTQPKVSPQRQPSDKATIVAQPRARRHDSRPSRAASMAATLCCACQVPVRNAV